MKVETPQILWNAEEEKGINAALMTVSIVESGILNRQASQYSHVLATAGNSTSVNLFKVSFAQDAGKGSGGGDDDKLVQRNISNVKIDFMCSLSRHEGSVNSVAFSPDGLHLATASCMGSVIVWSVPVSKRGGGNGRHFWSTVSREQDLCVKIISGGGDEISDLSWSSDSKRFMCGTVLDHSVFVCEDEHYESNRVSQVQKENAWKVIYRNGIDHTNYVQGVAYDPLGVYLASMSSDRTVRIYPRKTPPKSKKKVMRPAGNGNFGSLPPLEHAQMVNALLTDAKFELGKSKLLKYRRTNDEDGVPTKKQHLFADESTLQSYVRRLAWTSDGAYLVIPAALYQHKATEECAGNNTPPTFATYMFARHKFDEPCKALAGLEKPSIAVRPNPVLFLLPDDADSKENKSPTRGLPYRSIFAVLTHDSILLYDTHHNKPLSVVRGLHYANLVDATWTKDGHNLLVCSTDGYISILSFAEEELGQIYTPTVALETATVEIKATETPIVSSPTTPETRGAPETVSLQPQLVLPPCEPGQALVEARPAKKIRITPTLVSGKRSADEEVGHAVDQLSLDENKTQPKKKKRVQPTLVSTL